MTSEELQAHHDRSEALRLGVVIVYVCGTPARPPRLRGVWRYVLPASVLPQPSRESLGEWIAAEAGDSFNRILDWAAVGPAECVEWATETGARIYADSL